MHRARLEVEPPILVSAGECIIETPTTFLNMNYRHFVMIHIDDIDQYGAISIKKWHTSY